MKEKVTRDIWVVGFDGALATAITGVVDLLALAGVTYQRIQGQVIDPLFNLRVVASERGPIRCINGLNLYAEHDFQSVMSNVDSRELDAPYAVVVPTIGADIAQTLSKNQPVLAFLKWAKQNSQIISANCTGNFFLAEAGLLKDRQATTHWGFEEAFKRHYPDVDLRIDQLITQDENIYCAGGGLAWFDMGLLMIEQHAGYEVAIQTARAFVIDYRRQSQLSYRLHRMRPNHQDNLIQSIQDYLDAAYHEHVTLDDLAKKFNISQRTLIRRFKQALDVTPHSYIQNLRMEVAQKALAETKRTVEFVMQQVGYEDVSAFRRLFKQHTGLTPNAYRDRFARRL